MKRFFIFYFLFMTVSFQLFAQRNVTTVGVQIKPIFPNSFFRTSTQSITQNNVTFDLTLNSGFSAGMVIRHGFSDLLAFETGINYVKRKYDLRIDDGSFSGESQFRVIGYEIPVSLLVYIQLGEKIFMNASLGHSLDMFASDVQSYDYYFNQKSFRKSLFQSAILANLGFEYRSEKSGYFYLGASYHRPFSFIYASKIDYTGNGKNEEVITSLLGNYLTVDIRYFFYEDPKKKNRIPSED